MDTSAPRHQIWIIAMYRDELLMVRTADIQKLSFLYADQYRKSSIAESASQRLRTVAGWKPAPSRFKVVKSGVDKGRPFAILQILMTDDERTTTLRHAPMVAIDREFIKLGELDARHAALDESVTKVIEAVRSG